MVERQSDFDKSGRIRFTRDRGGNSPQGTYGRQLGQIIDAMVVLLDHLPKDLHLSEQESEALDTLKGHGQ